MLGLEHGWYRINPHPQGESSRDLEKFFAHNFDGAALLHRNSVIQYCDRGQYQKEFIVLYVYSQVKGPELVLTAYH